MKKLPGFLRHWEIIFFVCGLCVFCLTYGVIAGRYMLPPYPLFKKAKLAGTELWHWAELYIPQSIDSNAKPHPHIIEMKGGHKTIVINDSACVCDGVTFIAMFHNDRFGMVLIDLNGKVLHEWKIPEVLFDQVKKRDEFNLKKGHYFIHGAHLYSNGDVVFNIEHKALARIDIDSNLIWSINEPAHHLIFVEDNGTIWVPSQHFVKESRKAFPRLRAPYMEDYVLAVSPDGKVIDKISMLKAIYDGNYQGMLLQGGFSPEIKQWDVTHLNDVEIIGDKFGKANGFAKAGDILVSFRNLDSIAIIDRKDKKVKWCMTGPFLRQHDPDCLPDGTISIFDNRTDKGQFNGAEYLPDPQSFGYSRILRIVPKTQQIKWSYQGSMQQPFYSSINGNDQELPNGNVLIVEPEGGRVFEVDPNHNTIVWEYRNILKSDQSEDYVGRVTYAEKFLKENLDFLRTKKYADQKSLGRSRQP